MPKINVYLPDDLAEQVKARDLPVSAICQAALREEITRMETIEKLREDMDELDVDVNDPPVTVRFIGSWLVEPDSDETRTREPGYDAGAYWGVALTQRGRIAVYHAHCNEGWPATLTDFDNLAEAQRVLPADIWADAAGQLGEQPVIWRDI